MYSYAQPHYFLLFSGSEVVSFYSYFNVSCSMEHDHVLALKTVKSGSGKKCTVVLNHTASWFFQEEVWSYFTVIFAGKHD